MHSLFFLNKLTTKSMLLSLGVITVTASAYWFANSSLISEKPVELIKSGELPLFTANLLHSSKDHLYLDDVTTDNINSHQLLSASPKHKMIKTTVNKMNVYSTAMYLNDRINYYASFFQATKNDRATTFSDCANTLFK